MFKFSGIIFLTVLSLSCFAQNEVDALRYSYLVNGGTARFLSTGGAMGALGGDLSVMHYNPAGLARSKYAELSFSTDVTSQNTKSLYLGVNSDNSSSRMGFNNLAFGGIIHPDGNNEFNKWKRFVLGVSHSRMIDFKENLLIRGKESNSSILDVFTDIAYGVAENQLTANYPFSAGMAYEAYAIDPDFTNPPNYTHGFQNKRIDQTKFLERTGRYSETAVSYSGNWNDKVLIGGTIGFTSAKFSESARYTERNLTPTDSLDLIDMRLTESLDIRGSGVNAKLGIIYLVSESFRVGLAAHSPTRLNLADTWRYGMVTIFQDNFTAGYNTPEGQFRYRIITPWRVIGSAAIVAKQHGFISLDYEYVDYRQSKLTTYRRSQASYTFQNENAAIKNVYKATANIRLGAEFNPHKQFSVRGGFALYGSPFFDGSGATQIVSGGLGYRWSMFYANLGISHLIKQEKYFLYDAQYALPAAINLARTQISLSLGVRWTNK